ncbi:hypothetical protein TSTA_122090 [Talaromyces stipitatus ATCC 10500]|uniref:Zn(2)-C6 fungal-type domain-containing protein n=1 Tax=Talaromyces stipitatus (strain ATCC 10500 / CBS 375.48 / QM 6759 / NRRL 1006) TaxID=441959 RepID=B8MC27_TALSN|nr:uncharacterized protein TSTA_122090 [Talaromyces stipitatus ATCC 10500]EED18473.1 hypothetical protein TSTA_122090 [Talaromyces stipitatus ATCC 10500]
MFSTFPAHEDPRTTTNGSKSSTRPRRRQVARACDWCRINRVKCDDKLPCQNCQNRGGHCSISRPVEATSLPAANRDIQRLRSKVKDLQEQLQIARQEATQAQMHQAQIQTPFQSNHTTPSLYTSPDAVNDSTIVTEQDPGLVVTKGWQGLRDLGTRIGELYYGPRSSSYFLARVSRYVSSTLNESLGNINLKPFLVDIDYEAFSKWRQQPQSDAPEYAEGLTRIQQEYYLNLLWQAFHCVYPILSEPKFNRYYDSLWTSDTAPDRATRKPSALVDILLAVYSHLLDYLPLQHLPVNTAHSNLGTTLRIAQALKLHLQPEGTSLEDQAHLRRIWNVIYRLDAQLSMNLGRPTLVQHFELENDQSEKALLSGTSLLSTFEEISCLSFHNQCTKLISAVQGTQVAFEANCSQLLVDGNNVNGDIHDNPRTTEALAEFFGRKTMPVREWVQGVPEPLKCARRGEGVSFSTDRSPLNLDTYIPLWLQRQRLLLELLYHHLQISLLRQFLRFPPVAVSLTPLADGLGISCVYHAITITNILHQVLSETDLLHGWFHVYQFQWDAVLCTLGFVLANPEFGDCWRAFSAAASAALLISDLNKCMDRVIDAFRRDLMGKRCSSAASQKDSASSIPLNETVLQTLSELYLSPTATASSLGLAHVWPDHSLPALGIASETLVTTTDTPTVPTAIDDLQWMQGNLESWTDFTV